MVLRGQQRVDGAVYGNGNEGLHRPGRDQRQTYVWKNGMEDWVLLKHSELARYLKAETEARDPMSGNANPQAQRTFYASPVQERSIALDVILTIVTCGIYGLVWLYLLAKDVNELSAAQGKPQMTDPILVVLLSIVTCGLYEIYFFYQAGKAMYNLDSKVRLGDDSHVAGDFGDFRGNRFDGHFAKLDQQVRSVWRISF